MFLSELTPIWRELTQQPMTFAGGLVSGILRLNPNQDPLKSWLEQQGEKGSDPVGRPGSQGNNAPQSIDIE
jgi:hypothetical protein